MNRPAPVADWVSIPELYRDPFPIFERLRAEGGVHWVPAVNRYLVTSFDAVHDTELDQETYSANEQGSLMIRAMGHSMLRRDDPDHYIERRAWQPVLRPGVVKRTWLPVFERNAERYLREFAELGPGADLVWDFAAPYAAENLRAIIGLHNATAADLQRWSQTMIDATGNYADDLVVWAKGQASFDEVDEALDEMLVWHSKHPDDSLLSALLGMPDYRMPLQSIRANVKMTIGGGLNEPRDVIGVAAHALLADPRQRALAESGSVTWDDVFDEAVRWIAPIGMYSRQTTRDAVLQGVALPAGAKLGICILSANRDTAQWTKPEQFNAARSGEGAHLAFGKGVHVCLGAWAARAEVAAVALPRIFRDLPALGLVPENPPQQGGWVFRGMTSLPVRWDAATAGSATRHPRIVIVGSGPSGCYSAQALRKELPEAEISVLDSMPVPYGLVRYGVAADHQGTKAVSGQFARLFEKDGVRFHGGVTLGRDVDLAGLRGAFDAVVLAHGLHDDIPLDVPGHDLQGVVGAGRITRLLNGHPGEGRPVPSLGSAAAIVGMGNVALDLVRLLSKAPRELVGSDIDDEAHAALAAELSVIHVIGRSLPAASKFDPVMMREVIELDGVTHVVHGADELPPAGDDARSDVVRDLKDAEAVPGARVRVEWWFGHCPAAVRGARGNVSSIEVVQGGGASRTALSVESVISAVGFTAAPGQRHIAVDAEARETGRVEPGLYVAGWARRGPRGTIPSQRTDAKQLAALIARDIGAGLGRPGIKAMGEALATATSYDGWLLIDAHESRNASSDRIRRKVTDLAELRLIAGSALSLPSAPSVADESSSAVDRAQGVDRASVTIAFGTESGNSELVAEEVAAHLRPSTDVEVVDLGQIEVSRIRPDRLLLVICSTYGDGELPTTVRRLHGELTTGPHRLDGVRYAMFGLGDHSYETTYSRGSELLDAALSALGAVRVGDYGRHDAGGRESATALAIAWADSVIAAQSSARVG
ncbi:cytochrome P450 [Microbacterium sp. VKM Ac-2870]|uniref:cytochrome P450 n=1 Tax=Microbacterium sp. VKM Ac-2870 TaxID=2783825 RepID=UPI00188D3A93|nr:cytochrome P450 [Microbacterium sp. VKM Ac-2870]MBF4562814.1 cytochrome P450 [Microbacterium sp. VKM Ac-2870]